MYCVCINILNTRIRYSVYASELNEHQNMSVWGNDRATKIEK